MRTVGARRGRGGVSKSRRSPPLEKIFLLLCWEPFWHFFSIWGLICYIFLILGRGPFSPCGGFLLLFPHYGGGGGGGAFHHVGASFWGCPPLQRFLRAPMIQTVQTDNYHVIDCIDIAIVSFTSLLQIFLPHTIYLNYINICFFFENINNINFITLNKIIVS